MNKTIFMLVDEFPTTSGVYILRNGNVALYVGQAKNIKSRMQGHEKMNEIIPFYPNATIEIINCHESKLHELESEYIKKLQPLFNDKPYSSGIYLHADKFENGRFLSAMYRKFSKLVGFRKGADKRRAQRQLAQA